MNDAQIWASIIGGVCLTWHAINVAGRLRSADRIIRAAEVERNGRAPSPAKREQE